MHWMILPFKRYVDFQGRSRRMEFWMFQVLNLIVAIVLAGPFYLAFMGAAFSADPTLSDDAALEVMTGAVGMLGWIGVSLYGLYALAAFIPSLAVTVRRFHDRDMSGWWYVGLIVASLVPLLGFIASIALIVILFLPGTNGSNRFGPDPKAGVSAEVFE